MKRILVLIAFFSFYNLYSQSFQSREAIITKFKSRKDLQLTELHDNIFKISYPGGKTKLYNTSLYKNNRINKYHSANYDSTVIDIWSLDTTLYYQKFKLWTEVPISSDMSAPPFVADVDNNGFAELYGFQKSFTSTFDTIPIKVFELSALDSTFKEIYRYPDSMVTPRSTYDITQDGNLEFLAQNNNMNSTAKIVYKKPAVDSLATVEDFHFFSYGQINDITFGDYDINGKTDMLYYNLDRYAAIFEYNELNNKFDSIYAFNEPDMYGAGFSTGFIDDDKYPDIVMGTIHGYIQVLEFSPDSGYQNVWKDTIETYNVYSHFFTNDIDRNGKCEFWVGGCAFYDDFPKTLFVCYEADGDNSYNVVNKIWINGTFPVDAFNAFTTDIDGDSIEEIGMCLGDNFIILKFTGSPEYHSYELYFVKQNEMGDLSMYWGAIMQDIVGSYMPELVINMTELKIFPNEDKVRCFTRIYRPDLVSNISFVNPPVEYSILYPNYPNPFNPATNIKYQISNAGTVTLRVFDILGNEITELINEYKPAGEYAVRFDGSKYPSGVYIYSLKCNGYSSNKKMILMK